MRNTETTYVDMHKDTDVITDQNTYITNLFHDEIHEDCWIQMLRRKYIDLKYTNRIVEVKVEKKKKIQLTNDPAKKM